MQMLEIHPAVEDGEAEVTQEPHAEFIWRGVMIGIGLIILWWVVRGWEKWRGLPRISEENLQDSCEIPEIKRDGQGRISEEETSHSPCKFFEENLQLSSSKMEIFKEERLASPLRITEEKSLDRPSKISEEMSWSRPRRIWEGTAPATPECFGGKSLVERPLRKKDACKQCRLSNVVLGVNLSVQRGGTRFDVDADGPVYSLRGFIGNGIRLMKFLIDTGCSRSSIDLTLVKRLGLLDKVDRSQCFRYEAMGGERQFTYGMLCVPVRTKSGFVVIEELMVVEMGSSILIIGLDVLAVNNCSLLLDEHRPILMMRERDACSSFKGFKIRGSADVMAKFNGVFYKSTLDTGSIRTVVPKSLDFAQDSLSEPAYLDVAVKNPVRVSKKVIGVELEINGCVGCVDPFVMNEPHPMIGTDFLQNRRIDFIHGKVYVEPLFI